LIPQGVTSQDRNAVQYYVAKVIAGKELVKSQFRTNTEKERLAKANALGATEANMSRFSPPPRLSYFIGEHRYVNSRICVAN